MSKRRPHWDDELESGAMDVTYWKATWGTAWGAVRGLLLRDLIGRYPGWDQDAYDLLTGPWRQTVGPIHPDDGDSDE